MVSQTIKKPGIRNPTKEIDGIYRFGLTCCSVKIHRKEEAKARKSAYADALPIGGETHLP